MALFQLLSQNSKITFQKLDGEAAFDLNRDEGEARIDPMDEPHELQWSLSHWRDLRQPGTQAQQPAVEESSVEPIDITVPQEVATLQTLFPGFYDSIPENHRN